ncbi:MAG: hypothetical protein FWE23_08830 [Chitinivibrionia bacterium]|nr:hypothetical protein [Chitinivibrionia bacterium]
MIKKETKKGYKIDKIEVEEKDNKPNVPKKPQISLNLEAHDKNNTVALFKEIKNAKMASDLFLSDKALIEKYPLEVLIIEIEAAQELCKARKDIYGNEDPDIKTWHALHITKIKYLHKSAEAIDTDTITTFSANDIVKALKYYTPIKYTEN